MSEKTNIPPKSKKIMVTQKTQLSGNTLEPGFVYEVEADDRHKIAGAYEEVDFPALDKHEHDIQSHIHKFKRKVTEIESNPVYSTPEAKAFMIDQAKAELDDAVYASKDLYAKELDGLSAYYAAETMQTPEVTEADAKTVDGVMATVSTQLQLATFDHEKAETLRLLLRQAQSMTDAQKAYSATVFGSVVASVQSEERQVKTLMADLFAEFRSGNAKAKAAERKLKQLDALKWSNPAASYDRLRTVSRYFKRGAVK